MTTRLVVSWVGSDRTGLVERLSASVTAHGGNLEESRMASLGGEFAVIMLVTVANPQRAALEQALQAAATELGMLMLCKETGTAISALPHAAWNLHVRGMDHEGIVHPITAALATQGISIADLATGISSGSFSGTDIFTLRARVLLPATVEAASVQAELATLADRLNVDIDLEPVQV